MSSELGERIREARQRRRWTQTELAERVGVTLRTIGGWERGENSPQLGIAVLEAALGAPLTDPRAREPSCAEPPPEVTVLVTHWGDATQADLLRVMRILIDEFPKRPGNRMG